MELSHGSQHSPGAQPWSSAPELRSERSLELICKPNPGAQPRGTAFEPSPRAQLWNSLEQRLRLAMELNPGARPWSSAMELGFGAPPKSPALQLDPGAELAFQLRSSAWMSALEHSWGLQVWSAAPVFRSKVERWAFERCPVRT